MPAEISIGELGFHGLQKPASAGQLPEADELRHLGQPSRNRRSPGRSHGGMELARGSVEGLALRSHLG
ncbi:hypothetical protein [Blastococcus sp. PRF04-17]|uniref:hypothetical protein n=1 Tax=Blastococcus sp. PRF04-17 TaxID=2933797 RepID=UPI001FF1905A|nr:hypothetical protein [Blastococcus sp. PRF04-17]UOY01637.1 hypothetical protein MVA48_22405 [Blastococcus sp. PRF04-17]